MTIVSVNTEHAYMIGRNGFFRLRGVDITLFDHTSSVAIDGISAKKNMLINGGFGDITPEEMDSLCSQWLGFRGFIIKKKDE